MIALHVSEGVGFLLTYAISAQTKFEILIYLFILQWFLLLSQTSSINSILIAVNACFKNKVSVQDITIVLSKVYM